ncbi:uncharacterized protein MONBRDRAFT_25782 [Monosiga brevicollis MX1]|uniref:Uncharacterized protein n=1 Tax=Monosiga brevicollis TaxID=81824 RepID=A9V0E8_MONBE|nr:uncharacterized protein MONBRDRAFT_25782 [Monosiga brevicollis MX1]EDQ89145.1 predicted protein [Monosiga brevicollis MX1]|eukprot:XP_001746250.1 hypothetical protein [Monosiga brevicollis MX1]
MKKHVRAITKSGASMQCVCVCVCVCVCEEALAMLCSISVCVCVCVCVFQNTSKSHQTERLATRTIPRKCECVSECVSVCVCVCGSTCRWLVRLSVSRHLSRNMADAKTSASAASLGSDDSKPRLWDKFRGKKTKGGKDDKSKARLSPNLRSYSASAISAMALDTNRSYFKSNRRRRRESLNTGVVYDNMSLLDRHDQARGSQSSEASSASVPDAKQTAKRAARAYHDVRWDTDPDAWTDLSQLPPDPTLEPATWGDTVPSEELKGMDSRAVRRQDMIYEFIQTEKAFIRNLIILRVNFQLRLSHSGVLSQEQLDGLFANLDDIIALNGPFCQRLVDLQHEYHARSFPNMGENFQQLFLTETFDADCNTYGDFCANQSSSTRAFQALMRQDPHFERVINAAHAEPVCARLKFPDFIAKVMQRLSKYPLLIEGILKNTRTKQQHEERQLLSQCLQQSKYMMEFCPAHRTHNFVYPQVIDKKIKEQQDLERLHQIQDKLDFSHCMHHKHLAHYSKLNLIVNEERTMVREGTLDVVTDESQTKEVYVILFSDVAIFTQQKEAALILKCPGKSIVKAAMDPVLPLRGTIVRTDATDKRSLILVNTLYHKKNQSMYRLRAMNGKMKEQWWNDFQRCIVQQERLGRDPPLFEAAHVDDEPADATKLVPPSPLISHKSDDSLLVARAEKMKGHHESPAHRMAMETAAINRTLHQARSASATTSPTSRRPPSTLSDFSRSISVSASPILRRSRFASVNAANRYSRLTITVKYNVVPGLTYSFGLRLGPLPDHILDEDATLDGGLYVVAVAGTSDAERSGLRPGDVIFSCDGQTVRNQPPAQLANSLDLHSAIKKLQIARPPDPSPSGSTGRPVTLHGSLRYSSKRKAVLPPPLQIKEGGAGAAVGIGNWLESQTDDSQHPEPSLDDSVRTPIFDVHHELPEVTPEPQAGLDMLSPQTIREDESSDESRLATPQALSEKSSRPSIPELNFSPYDLNIPEAIGEIVGEDFDPRAERQRSQSKYGFQEDVNEMAALPPATPMTARVTAEPGTVLTIVIDAGAINLRLGLAGDEFPDIVTSSLLGDFLPPSDSRVMTPAQPSGQDVALVLPAGLPKGLSPHSRDVLARSAQAARPVSPPLHPLSVGVATGDADWEHDSSSSDEESTNVGVRQANPRRPGKSKGKPHDNALGHDGGATTSLPHPQARHEPSRSKHSAGASPAAGVVATEQDDKAGIHTALQSEAPNLTVPGSGTVSQGSPMLVNAHSPVGRTISVSGSYSSPELPPLNVDGNTSGWEEGFDYIRLPLGYDVLEAVYPPELSSVLRISYPLRQRDATGSLADWDGVALLLERTLLELLHEDTLCRVAVVDRLVGTTHRLMRQRNMIAEKLFTMQKVNVQSVLFADQAYLSCLGSGRRCALVVHVGDTYTQVVPVVRGDLSSEVPEPLLSCARASELAGDTVTQLLGFFLQAQAPAFTRVTRERYGGPKTQVLLRDIKDNLSFVSMDYREDMQSCNTSTALQEVYVMPDGDGEVVLGPERFSCVEPLFNSDVGFPHLAEINPARGPSEQRETIPMLVAECLNACPASVQDLLWSNIVLSGGTTLMPNFAERLEYELMQLMPGRPPLKIDPQHDRVFLPWLGAAMLGEMESMQNRFITREAHEARVAQQSALGSPLSRKPSIGMAMPLPQSPQTRRAGFAAMSNASSSSDVTIVDPANLSRQSSLRRSIGRNIDTEETLYNLDLSDLPMSGTTMSQTSAATHLDRIRSALSRVEEQILHLHATRDELQAELEVLARHGEYIDVVPEEDEREIDSESKRVPSRPATGAQGAKGKKTQSVSLGMTTAQALEALTCEARALTLESEHQRAGKAAKAKPGSPKVAPPRPPPPMQKTSSLEGATVYAPQHDAVHVGLPFMPFDSRLTAESIALWDPAMVASWFETVELDAMAERAFVHGINGKFCCGTACFYFAAF